MLFSQRKKSIVLVLNSLNALGDHQVGSSKSTCGLHVEHFIDHQTYGKQVVEKQQANFTAVNLTKLTFTKEVREEIKDGAYQFIYLVSAFKI